MENTPLAISISGGVNCSSEVEDAQPESEKEPPCKGGDGRRKDKKVVGNLSLLLKDYAAGSSRKGLSQCATSPKPESLSSKSDDGDDKTPYSELQENSYSRSISLPIPRKLVSAMKGSREKEGAPRRKLNVSWAPDVYDPPSTLSSHSSRKKKQPKNGKKHGKGKQKDKNERGGVSASRDKKNRRKGGGRSEQFFDLADSSELDDFGGKENPDSSCASSFLKNYYSTVRVAYAEAM